VFRFGNNIYLPDLSAGVDVVTPLLLTFESNPRDLGELWLTGK
jgi:hypothetical protein